MTLRTAIIKDAQTLGSRVPCVTWTMDILDRLEIQGIGGDFVECGVWRGAQPIVAKTYIDANGYRPRKYWLFDTFKGMPPPGKLDVDITGRMPAKPKDWLAVPKDQVEHNFAKRGILDDSVIFVEGMVEETLRAGPLPERISYLRLDTDFYSSTMAGLQALYPRLVKGGALVIDDYGWWVGCKAAVDRYFGDPPEMIEIDRSARLLWKQNGIG